MKLISSVPHKLNPIRRLVATSLFTCLFALFSPSHSHPLPLIGISQIVEHPALEDIRAGLIDALTKSGLQEGKDYQLQIKNAQGNMATNVQIAHQLAGLEAKVLVAISTPSAQALANATKTSKIPVVFGAVTDPKVAKLELDHVTGVSDQPPVQEQVTFIRQFLPNAKRIGVLFNPAEINSTILVDKFKELAKKEGLEIYVESAIKTAEVLTAARGLIGRVDAIYIPLDNTVVSAIDGLIRLQNEHQLPLITSDEALVKKGALAAIGANYFTSGQKVGEIVLRLLRDEKPRDIPVVYPEQQEIYIHAPTAEKLGITIPKEIADKAHLVKK